MACNAAALCSSSAALSPPKKYDVFISFRGEDTRANFTSHLYTALCHKHIQAFIDYRLHQGDQISAALVQAIQDSCVSVVVFSESYASSGWCMDELTHILHCKRVQGQLVIPVFYKVDASHVRHQTGTYKKAFEKHEQDQKHVHQKIQNWRAALTEVSNLAGWDSHKFRDDSELIQKIVEDISQKLNCRYPPIELKGLVGIDNSCAQIEKLMLEGVQTIGIWGMGGIGKTTIARALFNKYSSQYEGCCFLENVKEGSQQHWNGLRGLCCKFFSKLLEAENLESGSFTMESNFVKRRLSRKNVFIVLDDVSALEQLEYLALDGEHHCFGPGSRIIITTRDKHVLSKGVDKIYEVKELEFQESLELFNLNAFNPNLPIMVDEKLSKRAVLYAKGIPLALKVLGSFLRGKSENEWDSVLRKLEKIPHEEIQSMLRLSYEGLNYEEKEIFLDIACFLKGKFEEDVLKLLDNYGFYGAIGIRVLQDKALVTLDYCNRVCMHDMIQEMGHQIVREESRNKPKQRSRLWDDEEVYDVLANNKGTDKVEGIKLNVSQIRDVNLNAGTFKKMPNLRFLQLYSLSPNFGPSHVHLPRGLKFLPNKIRYLEWYEYPLKSLPSTFCAEKLVELRMHNSHVQRLWNGVQDLVNLKKIDFSESKQLVELPDFSKALNLKDVHLGGCESLHYLHSSILSLQSLEGLDLRGCKKIESLKGEIPLRSLEYLNVEGCLNLKEFSLLSEKIKVLYLHGTRVEILHSSIGRWSNLKSLNLSGLRLRNLPNELSCLRALTALDLSNCKVIDDSKLQILLDGLSSLIGLELSNCSNITELPSNIQHLSLLKSLFLCNCKKLRSLPKLPPSIIFLDASGCTSLETVMTSGPLDVIVEKISFENCLNLKEQSLHNIIEDAYSTVVKAAYECERTIISQSLYPFDNFICLPGSRVPEWFTYRTIQSSIVTEIPPNSNIACFAFCSVLHFAMPQFSTIFDCECYVGDVKVQSFRFNYWSYAEMKSDHVHIFFRKIKRRGSYQFPTNRKLSFKFSVKILGKILEPYLTDITVKEYGVCPIYVSEVEELARQLEYKSKFEGNNKRLRDFDEEETLPPLKKPKLDIYELEALLMRMDIT